MRYYHKFNIIMLVLISINFVYAFQPATKAELQTAVDLWVSDKSSAVTSHGEINTWDVSLITDMSSLFVDKSTFNDDLDNWNVSNVTDMRKMFKGVTSFNGDISSWNVSSVTNMDSMFWVGYSINQDLSNWNVSNVTSMSNMFLDANHFNGNISSWNVSKVTDMTNMFRGNTAFNQDLSNWNVSNVTNMNSMFYYASTFNSVLASINTSWDVANVTNMNSMFEGASSFNQDISSWDVSKVTDMGNMFENASIFNQDISSWNVDSVKNMVNMFENNTDLSDGNQCAINAAFSSNGNWPFDWSSSCYTFTSKQALQTAVDLWVSNSSSAIASYGVINSWNVAQITDMSNLFQNKSTFNDDIGNWDVSNVTTMFEMFFRASEFNQNIANWTVSKATNMQEMFSNATAFNQDISGWEVDSVTTFGWMFKEAPAFNQNIANWTVSNATNMQEMFNGATAFDQDLSSWDVSKVINMNSMFENASSFNQDISSWNVSKVTDMGNMFENNTDLSDWNQCAINAAFSSNGNWPFDWSSSCYTFTSNIALHYAVDLWFSDKSSAVASYGEINTWIVSQITDMSSLFVDKSTFNDDLDNWNVSNVTDMTNMFKGNTAFNQDLSNWNVSKVTDMGNMFYDAQVFNADISSWDVDSVKNMAGMFLGAEAFNQDIGSWNVSSVTNMHQMFFNAKVFNGDISGSDTTWNVSSVTDMGSMFYGATNFNADLSSWKVSNVTNMNSMFENASSFNWDISRWDISRVTDMGSMFYGANALSETNKCPINTKFSVIANWPHYNQWPHDHLCWDGSVECYDSDCPIRVPNQLISGYGQSLYFDGLNDKVTIPFSQDLNPNNFTVMLWVNMSATDASGKKALVVSLDNSLITDQRGYSIELGTTNELIFSLYNGSQDEVFVMNQIPVNKWTHLAVTYSDDNKKAAVYINGIQAVTPQDASFSPNQSADMIIGSFQDQYYFTGRIDEVSIWDVALTAEQVNAKMGSLYSKTADNLIGYWHMDHVGNAKTDLVDFINNNHPGILSGYNSQFNHPDSSWKKSGLRQKFIAVEDELFEGSLYGYEVDDQYMFPFIFENTIFGDLNITDADNHYFTFLSDTNYNSSQIKTNLRNISSTSVNQEDGSLLFSYHLSAGNYLSPLDTALIYISPFNDAPKLLNPEDVQKLPPIMATSSGGSGTNVNHIIKNFNITDPDTLMNIYDNASTNGDSTIVINGSICGYTFTGYQDMLDDYGIQIGNAQTIDGIKVGGACDSLTQTETSIECGIGYTNFSPNACKVPNSSYKDIPDKMFGIAVTSIDDKWGTWQYQLNNNGSSWENMNIGTSQSLLLNIDDYIRFQPVEDNPWKEFVLADIEGANNTEDFPVIQFRIWDKSSYTHGDVVTIDSTSIGGTSPFSTTTASTIIELIIGPPVAGFGNALQFNGDGAYISLEEGGIVTDSLFRSGSWTVEMWINPTYDMEYDLAYIAGISYIDMDNNPGEFHIGITTPDYANSSDQNKLFLESYSGDKIFQNDTTITMGQWNHIAVVYNGQSDVTLYVNGVSDGISNSWSAGNFMSSATSFFLGGIPLSQKALYSKNFRGSMDDVRVWNVARSGDQIQNNMYTIFHAPEPNLIGYYSFDEMPQDAQTLDNSGNGFYGTLHNDFSGKWLETHTWKSDPILYFNPHYGGNFITLPGFISNPTTTEGGSLHGSMITAGDMESNGSLDDYTYSMWVYPDEQSPCNAGDMQVILSMQDVNGIGYGCSGGIKNKFVFWSCEGGQCADNGSFDNVITSGILLPGQWYHLAISVDGINSNQSTAYINGYNAGTAVASSFTAHLSRWNSLSLGALLEGSPSQSSHHFSGSLVDFRAWDRALSQSDVNEVMIGDPQSNQTVNLLRHYKFNEGNRLYNDSEYNYVYDYSGLDNHGLEFNSKYKTVPLVKHFTVSEDSQLLDTLQGYDLGDSIENMDINWSLILDTKAKSGSSINLTNSADGSFTYTPGKNFNSTLNFNPAANSVGGISDYVSGPDIINFSIYDDANNSDSAITFIYVSPVNDAPVMFKTDTLIHFTKLKAQSGYFPGQTKNHGYLISDLLKHNSTDTQDIMLGYDVDLPHYTNFNDAMGIAVVIAADLEECGNNCYADPNSLEPGTIFNQWYYCKKCVTYNNYVHEHDWKIINTTPNLASTKNAFLLGPNDRIAFNPIDLLGNDTTVSFTFKLWDMSSGNDITGFFQDASITGGITEFSNDSLTVVAKVSNSCIMHVPFIDVPFVAHNQPGVNTVLTLSDGLTIDGIEFGGNDFLTLEWEPGGIVDTNDATIHNRFIIYGQSSFNLGDESLVVQFGTKSEPGLIVWADDHCNYDVKNIQQIHLTITEDFQWDGFDIKTGTPKPTFQYHKDHGYYEMKGEVDFSWENDSIKVDLQEFIVEDGSLQTMILSVGVDFTTKKLQFSTPDDNLPTIEYDKDGDQFKMYGDAELTIESNDDDIEITFGDQNNPGIILNDGKLDSLSADINSDLKASKFEFITKDLTLTYSNDLYTIEGEVDLILASGFEIDVTLGTPTLKGIEIRFEGNTQYFYLDAFTVDMTSLELGALDFKEVEFSYVAEPEPDFNASLEVSFPPGYEVDATLEFVDIHDRWELNALHLSLCVTGNRPGIEIGETGLELVGIDGGASNFTDPSNLEIDAGIAVVLADQFKMGNKEVTLARSQDNVTITPHELILNAVVLLGAEKDESKGCGDGWTSELAYGDLTIDLNWSTHVYYIEGQIDIPTDYGFRLDEKLWITPSAVILDADAEVRVPHGIPVVGGWHLGEIGFGALLKHGHGPSPSLQHGSFFAAWTHLFWPIGEVGIELEMNPNAMHFLGGGGVAGIENQLDGAPLQRMTYSSSSIFLISSYHLDIPPHEYITGMSLDINFLETDSTGNSRTINKPDLGGGLIYDIIYPNPDSNYITVALEGITGNKFALQQVVHTDSAHVKDITITSSDSLALGKNNDTLSVFRLRDLTKTPKVLMSTADTSLNFLLSSDSYYNVDNQDDLQDLSPGRYSLEIHYPNVSGNENVYFDIQPHLHYQLPTINVENVIGGTDTINFQIDYWAAPALVDSVIINVYVDLDSTIKWDGHIFQDFLYPAAQAAFGTYDTINGGSINVSFVPGNMINNALAHSVFDPYYFYASIHDGSNRPIRSHYSEGIYIVPPIYGQVFENVDTLGLVAMKTVPVFIDLDKDGFFTSKEPFADEDSSSTYTYTCEVQAANGECPSGRQPNDDNCCKYSTSGAGESHVEIIKNGKWDNYVDIIDHTDPHGAFAFHNLGPDFDVVTASNVVTSSNPDSSNSAIEIGIVVPYGMMISDDSPAKDQEIIDYQGVPIPVFFFLEKIIKGCTDTLATNYQPKANVPHKGSCIYAAQ